MVIFFITINCNANKNDSLLSIYQNTSISDSNRLKAINKLADGYTFVNPDSSIYFSLMQLNLAKQTKDLAYQASAYQIIGTSHYVKKQLDTTITYYNKSLELYKKCNNEKGLASIYNNIGIMHEIKGEYLKAINYYLDGITIQERRKNISGTSKLYLNIANVYVMLEVKEKSLHYYWKSHDNFVTLSDSGGIAKTYMGMALTYQKSGPPDSALFYYKKCLEINEKMNFIDGINQCRINLGIFYMNQKQYDKATELFTLAKDYYDENDDLINKATLLENLGLLDIYLKKYQSGINYCEQSLQLSIEYQLKDLEKNACECLYKGYKGLKNPEKALKYYQQFIEAKDSLQIQNISKDIARKEIQFEYDKKMLADSLATAEKIRINQINHEQEVKQQKTYLLAGSIAFSLMLLLLIVMYRSYTQKKKSNTLLEQKNQLISTQKEEVEQQKLLVENKNTEITDSINYAKRIQSAILPPQHFIEENLPNAFIYFNPKDLVSGDFYWMHKSNDEIIFAVADCTGHGVPGAMVSVVCSNALNRAVKEFNLTQPSEILDKTRELVIETFEKSKDDVKDGMDISLCNYNNKTKTLQFAGANNPLWILKNGTSEIDEIKADKQPIGVHLNPQPFTNFITKLNKGDIIYLFSDGFADQFGGEKGKKLKYKPFKELLIESTKLSTIQQKEFLLRKFEEWKGEIEQVDDVCVIGITIG